MAKKRAQIEAKDASKTDASKKKKRSKKVTPHGCACSRM